MFSEWGNRGLHYWEVAANSVTLIENQNEYVFYRSPGDGTSSAVQTTLSASIDNVVTTIPLVFCIWFSYFRYYSNWFRRNNLYWYIFIKSYWSN
jgi:hypothetical protein